MGIDFAELADGEGWGAGWRSAGVANVLRTGGEGVLEAGSDVFPNDPRPIVFAVDKRVRDAEITATITRPGSAPGVVLRRTSPRSYYAAVYDTGRGALRLLRRSGVELVELASTPVPAAEPPLRLVLSATGAHPTELRCELTDSRGVAVSATARDEARGVQRKGDPGVLATAETLFPSDTNPVLPALGNLHLLPWAVQEGQAFMATQLGQAVVEEIRRRSTVAFSEITVRSARRRPPRGSAAGVLAATTGRPLPGGAELHVASDVPARAAIEISYSPRFRNSRRVVVGRTDSFQAVTKRVRGLCHRLTSKTCIGLIVLAGRQPVRWRLRRTNEDAQLHYADSSAGHSLLGFAWRLMVDCQVERGPRARRDLFYRGA